MDQNLKIKKRRPPFTGRPLCSTPQLDYFFFLVAFFTVLITFLMTLFTAFVTTFLVIFFFAAIVIFPFWTHIDIRSNTIIINNKMQWLSTGFKKSKKLKQPFSAVNFTANAELNEEFVRPMDLPSQNPFLSFHYYFGN